MDGGDLGERIRRLRAERGISRADLARRLSVDVTALAAWERGAYRPRDGHRAALAAALGLSVERLVGGGNATVVPLGEASLLDTFVQLPALFAEQLPLTHRLRALRIAAPYCTAAHVQVDLRFAIAERLAAGTIEVQRIEIFYKLDRLKEGLSNVLRYEGRPYFLKSYCPGANEVTPGMGAYFFDEREFVLGGYWTGVPPHNKPGLRCSGEPFATFYMAYWHEIWSRGTLLSLGGNHDLSAVRDMALALGLKGRDWPAFVESARTLEIGDGAPPLF